MSIRAVIFDCFGVLYLDPTTSFYENMVPDYHQHRRELADLDKQYDYGLIDREAHAQAVSELSGLTIDTVREQVRGDHRRNDRLLDFSQSLRPKFKVGMVSNIGSGGMESFFSKRDQEQYFDDVVLSSDVMLIKPDPEIFHFAAERLNLRPDECVMIDDRRENIDGAERAGMKAILHLGNRHTIDALNGLVEKQ